MVDGGAKKTKLMAKLIGSSTAGILEISIFHPSDTVAKRLMSNTASGGNSDIISLKKVVFRENVNKNIMTK